MSRVITKIRPAALAVSLLIAAHAHAAGTIADGLGNISKDGTTTTVTQRTNKLIINWDNMDVAKGEMLSFQQPNAKSAVLNRINSADPTSILGTLNANGRVLVVNPNGVLIGNGAKINVGSLIASALDISDDDFKANTLRFSKGGAGDVVNKGEINATGSVGLIGAKKVENTGTIRSDGGNVVLAAADDITLAFADSKLRAKLNKASLEALVDNGGLIATSDGNIMLTAWARESLTRSVVNNGGVLEALSLGSQASSGNIKLRSKGDGEIQLSGTLKAQHLLNVRSKGDVAINGDLSLGGNATIAGRNVKTIETTIVEEFPFYNPGFYMPGYGYSGGYSYMQKITHTINPSISASGDLTVTASKSASLLGVTSGNNIKVTAKDELTVRKVAAKGNLDLTSQGNVKNYDQLTAGNDLNITAGESATLSGVISAKNVKLSGLRELTVDGVYADGDLKVESQGDVNIKGNLSSGGNAIITGRNIKTVGVDIYSPGYSTPGYYYPGSNYSFHPSISAAGDLTVTASKSASMAGLVSGRDVKLEGNDGLTLHDVNSGGAIKLTSRGSVDIKGELRSTSGTTLNGQEYVKPYSPYDIGYSYGGYGYSYNYF